MLRVTVVALLLALAGVLLYVRLSPNPPSRWHVDPLLVQPPDTPNYHLIRPAGGDAAAPIYDMTPGALAEAIDRVARADGARLLGGSVENGHMTYITRTPWLGFPDFSSVKVTAAGDGATFAAFARARFGRSDMGVNRARLRRWIDALAQ